MVIEAKFKTVSTNLLADRVEFFQSDTMPIKHATIEKNLTDRGLSFVRGTLSMSRSEILVTA
jgi:hypothetical protein